MQEKIQEEIKEKIQEQIFINLEFTPNPNTLKYVISKDILPRGAKSFTKKEQTIGVSLLAEKFFDIPGICGLMFGKNFVTVTKDEAGDWDLVHQKSSQLLNSHLNQGLAVLENQIENDHKQTHSDIEIKIKDFLDAEVRPAVAMDGGDITFDRYENGVVYVFLQGACSGCPSSTMTLKMGIEKRIKEVIPEILEVVAI
jgi:Fe-S cluster biogenesis protein NfuA